MRLVRQPDRAVPHRTPGVEDAAVNLATERATVRVDPDGRRPRRAGPGGRGGRLRRPPGRRPPARRRRRGARGRARPRTTSSASAPSATTARPGRRLDRGRARDHGPHVRAADASSPWRTLNRLVLLPATFVQLWAGGRFYRAAWRAARHGSATMDTLVAMGTTAAWGYSVVVTLWPEVVDRRGHRARHLLRHRRDHHRPRPARPMAGGAGEGPDGGRDPALIGLQAPTARRSRDGGEAGRRARARRARATCCASGPATRCPVDGVVVEGASARRRVDAHRRVDAGRRRRPATR